VDTNGIITAVAGNGMTGSSGDGGAATNARLNEPYGLALDAVGNVYIADSDNNRIREVFLAGFPL
jgi:DNA-binding beta-propeller fold protein YncE